MKCISLSHKNKNRRVAGASTLKVDSLLNIFNKSMPICNRSEWQKWSMKLQALWTEKEENIST